jgi:hypothetical protein
MPKRKFMKILVSECTPASKAVDIRRQNGAVAPNAKCQF